MLAIYDEAPSEELSDYDSDLENFIVGDEIKPIAPEKYADEDESRDRIHEATASLRPNETMTQKVLKAHISVLVSALGGPDHTSLISPPPYKLGHDALACLKDIKRWIKAIDERTNVYDVALACYDSGLLVNDLIVILCQWENEQSQLIKSKTVVPQHRARVLEKIMLSCLELIVLLTWPLELTPELTPNQRLSYPNLKKAQLTYKKEILAFQGGQTLKAVIRLILPIIAKPRIDRETRDNAIIRMSLFLIRNILFIEPANTSVSMKSRKEMVQLDSLPSNVSKDDVSISAVLSSFKANKVLVFLLTITGSLGTEFDRQMFGGCALECIYLLVRGVQPRWGLTQPLSVAKKSGTTNTNTAEIPDNSNSNSNSHSSNSHSNSTTSSGIELQQLLATESKRKQLQSLSISTRHGRFGSLISIDSNTDKQPIIVSGQEGLLNTNLSLEKLDSTKKWNARKTFKYDADAYLFKEAVSLLNGASVDILREFVDQFLASGSFNTLISCLSWILTSNGDLSYTDAYERACYFLVVSWFFQYKREMPILLLTQQQDNLLTDSRDFGSVGSALSETNFVLLLSYYRLSYESRDWNSLHVAMMCLREMLLISHGVFKFSRVDSALGGEEEETDRELAEGIIHKLFESKSFLDLIIEIPKTAAKHSPDYLNVCLHVVHIVLKTFESFANEDIALYVKAKRKQAKKKTKASEKQSLDHNTEMQFRDLIEGSEGEDDELVLNDHAKIVSKERRLDFKATELRFFHPSIVSTYIVCLSRFEDLSDEEIKRCLSYFHRLFVVRKDYTNLYRLDFMNLLHKLRVNLPRSSKIRDNVDEFIYYFMKKFKSAFKRFPMCVEMLFPRIEDSEYRTYLSSGELFVKPEKKTRKAPRLGKDLEFVRSFTLDEKLKIIITILSQEEKESFIHWFISELERIVKKRLVQEGDEDVNLYLQPTHEDFKRFLIGNSYVRVLVSTVGFELPYIMEEQTLLPSSVSSESINTCIELIKKWLASQPVSFDDAQDPTYFLRVKESIRNKDSDTYDDEVNYKEGEYDSDNESIAFETNDFGDSQAANDLDELDALEEGLTKGVARVKRKSTEKESDKTARKKKKSKSTRRPPRFNVNSDDEGNEPKTSKSSEFVNDSDDESDDEKQNEFFEREERLRRMLEESGGIVNPLQLQEFKKAWNNLESNGGAVSQTVSKAIESTLFVLEDAVVQDEAEVVQDEVEEFSDTDHGLLVSSQSSISPETNTPHNKEPIAQAEFDVEEVDGEIEGEEAQITRKKRRVVIDEDDE